MDLGGFHVRFLDFDTKFEKLLKFYTKAMFWVLFYKEKVDYQSPHQFALICNMARPTCPDPESSDSMFIVISREST